METIRSIIVGILSDLARLEYIIWFKEVEAERVITNQVSLVNYKNKCSEIYRFIHHEETKLQQLYKMVDNTIKKENKNELQDIAG